MDNLLSNCARCPFKIEERACRVAGGKAPEFCPTLQLPELLGESLKMLADKRFAEFARQASIQEAEGYANRDSGYPNLRPIKTRIEEIAEFAHKMKYRRLGLAFCVGLRREAEKVATLYTDYGFEVVSVICKAGCSDKANLSLDNRHKVVPSEQPEAMCNPFMQALTLNRAETEFNILLGLCVGHDSLFLQVAEAPCTVLAVKDRVLAHNPLATVYNLDSYYRALKNARMQADDQ